MCVFLRHFTLKAVGLNIIDLSDRQQLALVIFAAAALKTAARLCFGFFLSKAEAYFVKALVSYICRQNLGSDPALLFAVGIVDSAFVTLADIGNSCVERLIVQEGVDSLGAAVGLADCLNSDRGSSVGSVADSEYSLNIGVKEVGIGFDIAALVKLKLGYILLNKLLTYC